MAKAPFVCRLFGHPYIRFAEVWTSYRKCARCGNLDNSADRQVYQFEVNQWFDLMNRTGRTLDDLQNDHDMRDYVWDAVNWYRDKINWQAR